MTNLPLSLRIWVAVETVATDCAGVHRGHPSRKATVARRSFSEGGRTGGETSVVDPYKDSIQICASYSREPRHPGHLPGLASRSVPNTNPHCLHRAGSTTTRCPAACADRMAWRRSSSTSRRPSPNSRASDDTERGCADNASTRSRRKVTSDCKRKTEPRRRRRIFVTGIQAVQARLLSQDQQAHPGLDRHGVIEDRERANRAVVGEPVQQYRTRDGQALRRQ
jgi:hypothetical protein